MPWTVSAYENSEIPEPRWLDAGTFETAAEAITCANGIIRKSLLDLYEVNDRPNADGLLMAYLCYGEVPSIFGEPPVCWDTYRQVRREIVAITGQAASDSPSRTDRSRA